MFDAQGLRHSVLQKHIENFPGWRIIVMSPSGYDYFSYIGRFFGQNRSLVFPLLGLICFSVILLYKRASIEFNQRRLAEAALRKNEERFRILYSRTPAMLHSIDSQSRLVRVSDYWIETMGYTRDEVVGRPITDFMTEDSKRYALEVVIPQFMEEGFCKDVAYCFKKKDGEVIDVLLSAIAELDEEGNLFRSLSIVVDVTEQNKVEKRLKTAQDQLRSYSRELERQVKERTLEITNIMKYTPALVSLKDLKGRYQLVNTRFEEIFGVDATSVRGKTDREVFPPTIADGLSANDEKVVETREPLSIEETIPRGGADRTYLSVKFPLFGPRGGVNGVGAISTDVTALKQAQEQLRSMSNRIVQGQERERAAISRELHDELGQVLTALKMDAAWLLKRVGPVDSNAGDRAKAMCEMIDATIDEVRSMVMRLRPGVLDDLGLTAALEWVAHEFEKRTGTTCTFRHSDIPEVGEEAATAVYRITQESLTNVTRHAKASLVEVSLAAEGEELVLRVSDDGRGLDSLGDAETGGHGLAGIRERASLIGATIEISSRQGRGVSLTFRLPVAWPPEEVAV